MDAQAPRISPARGPPLWDDSDAPVGDGVDVQPDLGYGSASGTRLRGRPAHKLVNYKPSVQNRLGVGLRLWRDAFTGCIGSDCEPAAPSARGLAVGGSNPLAVLDKSRCYYRATFWRA